MAQLLSEPKVRTYTNSSAVYGPPAVYSPYQVHGMPPMLPMAVANAGRPNQYMPPTPTMPANTMMGVAAPGMKQATVAAPYNMVPCITALIE